MHLAVLVDGGDRTTALAWRLPATSIAPGRTWEGSRASRSTDQPGPSSSSLQRPVRGPEAARPGRGRTADDAAFWLAQQPAAWRDAVQVVAIDMCAVCASAVARMLPQATMVVDLFHVQLTVKMTGDEGRRVARARYGRRGRSGDPEQQGQAAAGPQRRGPDRRPVRQGHREPGRRPARPASPGRLDRQGEAPRRPQPARQGHPLSAVPARRPGPAVPVLPLVRPARRHPLVGHPGQDHLLVEDQIVAAVLTGVTKRQERGAEPDR